MPAFLGVIPGETSVAPTLSVSFSSNPFSFIGTGNPTLSYAGVTATATGGTGPYQFFWAPIGGSPFGNIWYLTSVSGDTDNVARFTFEMSTPGTATTTFQVTAYDQSSAKWGSAVVSVQCTRTS